MLLAQADWDICTDNVQNCWNDIERIIINIVDKLAPLAIHKNNSVVKTTPPRHIKRFLNSRKRALKLYKAKPNVELKSKIKDLNIQIRHFN